MTGSGVVELRRYALHAGARETLIELFERELVETQEAVGMRVLGTFRDPDDSDCFVWLRGFTDMSARPHALQAFYGGPVWARHQNAANATMIDSDNVLLLRPLDPASRLDLDATKRPSLQATEPRRSVGAVTICALEPDETVAFAERFERELEPALRRAGANVRARFVTEPGANNFPALPVREGENFFVWLSVFADDGVREEHLASVDLRGLLDGALTRDPETWRLDPTRRSLLPDG